MNRQNENFANKDLYEILHIKKDATFDEIKIAYRRLARIYHPDINESKESSAIFKEVRYAFDILSDENKRNLYDIKNGFNIKEEIKEEEPEEIPEPEINTKEKSFSNILGEIIDGIFVYVKKVSDKSKTKKGEDIFANVSISPKEALFGTSRIINVMQTKLCPNCEGKKFINEALCPLCNGSGEITNHKRINTNIEPNTKNGAKIKIQGCGNQGINGGKSGDLYLIISVDEKSLFNVKDGIVYMDLPITPYEAALGANIEIPTFYENIIIKIPPNTSSGQQFRLKGQGINHDGDMIVTALIKIPNKLSDKEIELYKSLRENSSCNIREGLKNDG